MSESAWVRKQNDTSAWEWLNEQNDACKTPHNMSDGDGSARHYKTTQMKAIL